MFEELSPFVKLLVAVGVPVAYALSAALFYRGSYGPWASRAGTPGTPPNPAVGDPGTPPTPPVRSHLWENLLLPFATAMTVVGPILIYVGVMDGLTHSRLHGIGETGVKDPIRELKIVTTPGTPPVKTLEWKSSKSALWVAINAYSDDDKYETFVVRANGNRWDIPSDKTFAKFRVSYGAISGPSAPAEKEND